MTVSNSPSISSPECISRVYLIRTGNGEIGHMQAGQLELAREDRIVCRTHRGIEMAAVLTMTHTMHQPQRSIKFLRRTRPEDELLWKQLRMLSTEAAEDCQRFLDEVGLNDVLVEVEPLLDGKTLYFHFLGQPSAEMENHVQELATVYQRRVASSHFAKLLESGCGPGCGTSDKKGCGTSSGCAVCSVANKCAS